MKDDFSIEEIQQEATERAIEFIKSNQHMSTLVNNVKETGPTIKELADKIEKYARNYAYSHGKKFGDLFDAELDLVDWLGMVGRV